MTENEKLEIIARAICEASGYGADPDRDVPLGGGRLGKRWELDLLKARAAKAAMVAIDAIEISQRTTAPNVLNVQRKIHFLPEPDDSPIQRPSRPKVSKRLIQLD